MELWCFVICFVEVHPGSMQGPLGTFGGRCGDTLGDTFETHWEYFGAVWGWVGYSLVGSLGICIGMVRGWFGSVCVVGWW